jgi:sec-independent protein translocase protein TatC
MNPLGHHQKLIYLTPAGGFNFVFMVTFYVTMLLMLPFFLYQIYAFIRPAVPSHTRKLSIGVALAATALMMVGASFGYIFAVPAGLDFLMHFAGDYVTPSLTADSYLSFILGYVFGIGALFELPLLLLFWHWIHPLTPGGLLKSERYLIVGAFIVAGVISPSPDALTQTIIAVPLVIVYQFGVIAVLVSIRKKRRKMQQVAHVAPAKPAAVIASASTPPPPSYQLRPVKAPAAIAHGRSVDGVLKTPRTSRHSTFAAPPPRPLVVAPRPRLISDFGPIRHPSIDTTH